MAQMARQGKASDVLSQESGCEGLEPFIVLCGIDQYGGIVIISEHVRLFYTILKMFPLLFPDVSLYSVLQMFKRSHNDLMTQAQWLEGFVVIVIDGVR